MKNLIDLNLAYPEVSMIPFKAIQYKDNQVDVSILGKYDEESDVCLVSRMNNYEDLYRILSANDALRKPPYSVELYAPCFLGQRSDKRVTEQSSMHLRLITESINYAKFKSVSVLHPHSEVLPALLDRCLVINQAMFYDWAFNLLSQKYKGPHVMVSPDAGAYKNSEKISRMFGLDLVPSVKARVGNDIKQDIVVTESLAGKTCVIVDDYIDGGRTFSGLARLLKDKCRVANVVLIVTHGLFSYGYDIDGIDWIYTTNSIKDIKHEKIIQYEVMRAGGRFYENGSTL
jgi:ribose-phosphate pyrophosphokinase